MTAQGQIHEFWLRVKETLKTRESEAEQDFLLGLELGLAVGLGHAAPTAIVRWMLERVEGLDK